MRTLKISLLVFILSITISAQWYQQNSGTGNSLFAVCFTSINNGIVLEMMAQYKKPLMVVIIGWIDLFLL